MIGADEINAALDRVNPQHGAVASIAETFGNAEAIPLVNDLMAALGVDTAALRDFARAQLVYYLEEGDALELAAHKVNAMVLGITVGIAAAREESE